MARQALRRDRIAEANRERTGLNAAIRRRIGACLKQIGIRLEEMGGAVAALADSDPGPARRRDIPAAIAGIGTVTGKAIPIEMSEPGIPDDRQASSLSGLAPVTRAFAVAEAPGQGAPPARRAALQSRSEAEAPGSGERRKTLEGFTHAAGMSHTPMAGTASPRTRKGAPGKGVPGNARPG